MMSCGIGLCSTYVTPHAKPSAIYSSNGLLPTSLPLFTGGLQLSVALRVDLLLPPGQHILRLD
jgi:hypothetical protein